MTLPVCLPIAVLLSATLSTMADDRATPLRWELEAGTATFESTTNMPGIDVKGKSTAMTGRVDVASPSSGLSLRGIDATVPVKSLVTGMKVRDDHMRKYVFTTADGQTPDIRFEAAAAACNAPSGGKDFVCKVPGTMTIRGANHAVELTLQAKQQSASQFRVSGESVVKLSDFGITPPSQFGVTPANEVKVRLEFTARQKGGVASASGGRD